MKKSKETKGKSRIIKIALVVAIIALVAVAAYVVLHKPKAAKQGDVVLVNYVGKINSTVFDTNIESAAKESSIFNAKRSYKPMEIQIGAGKLIKGFEDALYGMREGETKTVTIPPELAYGAFDAKKIVSVPKKSINTTKNLTAGAMLTDQSGKILRILSVNETDITIDFNHPLADRTLTFDITLIKIK